jgi:hypothetical protein
MQKYVKVQFEKSPYSSSKAGQVYTYLVPEGDEPAIGDRVITSTASRTSFEQGYPLSFKMAVVINVLTEDDGKATKHYLYLLSEAELQRRDEANKAAVAKRAEIAALKKQMDERIKDKLDIDRHKKFAAEDAELAELVRKFEELSK